MAALCVLLSGCMSTAWIESASVPSAAEYTEAGSVTVRALVWNVLFLRSPEERAARLLEAAEKKAIEEYGPEAILANLDLVSRWSPYSLILGLDLLGFAEDAALTADVLMPAPSPPAPPPPTPVPEQPEREVRVCYPIFPRERYDDRYGYIALEYLTKPEVHEEIQSRLEKRGARPEEYEKEYAKVPPGGHIVVSIGRRDLMHANTRWYDYTVKSGDTIIIKKKGDEGIPNIKGRDGNWWNEVVIPLGSVIENSVEVQVNDTMANVLYVFTVTKVEEVVER